MSYPATASVCAGFGIVGYVLACVVAVGTGVLVAVVGAVYEGMPTVKLLANVRRSAAPELCAEDKEGTELVVWYVTGETVVELGSDD